LGPIDFVGALRLNEDQFDIGAYENHELVFRDGFETLL
jgi:hypothetical protein